MTTARTLLVRRSAIGNRKRLSFRQLGEVYLLQLFFCRLFREGTDDLRMPRALSFRVEAFHPRPNSSIKRQYTQGASKWGFLQSQRLRFAAGAAVAEVGHVLAHG